MSRWSVIWWRRLHIGGLGWEVPRIGGKRVGKTTTCPQLLLEVVSAARSGSLQLLERDGIGRQLGRDCTAEERIVEVDADLADIARVKSHGDVLSDVCGEHGRDVPGGRELDAVALHLPGCGGGQPE